MKKPLFLLLSLLSTLFAFSQTNFFDYKVKNIVGDSISLSIFKGQKIMVVNTASLCGFTPQYAELQQLYDQYKKDNFVIIAFPSNDFGNQEPGVESEILEFCKSTYGVTFPIMSKVFVKGTEIEPVYKFLTQKSLNGKLDAPIQWNFQKFLINEDGTINDFLPSSATPLAPKVTQWIQKGVGIPDSQTVDPSFSVYPSPANEEFNILVAVGFLSDVKVKLMNFNGKVIDVLFDGMIDSDLRISYLTDKLSAGTYLVVAEVNSEKLTQQLKVVK